MFFVVEVKSEAKDNTSKTTNLKTRFNHLNLQKNNEADTLPWKNVKDKETRGRKSIKWKRVCISLLWEQTSK